MSLELVPKRQHQWLYVLRDPARFVLVWRCLCGADVRVTERDAFEHRHNTDAMLEVAHQLQAPL